MLSIKPLTPQELNHYQQEVVALFQTTFRDHNPEDVLLLLIIGTSQLLDSLDPTGQLLIRAANNTNLRPLNYLGAVKTITKTHLKPQFKPNAN